MKWGTQRKDHSGPVDGPTLARHKALPVLCCGGRRKEGSINRHFKKHYHLPWLLQQFEKNNSNHNIPDQSCGWVYEFDFHVNSALYTKWVVTEIWRGRARAHDCFQHPLPGPWPAASPHPHAGDTVQPAVGQRLGSGVSHLRTEKWSC